MTDWPHSHKGAGQGDRYVKGSLESSYHGQGGPAVSSQVIPGVIIGAHLRVRECVRQTERVRLIITGCFCCNFTGAFGDHPFLPSEGGKRTALRI